MPVCCYSSVVIGGRLEHLRHDKIAAKIAEALDVSLDFLMGLSSELVKDKKMVIRLEDIKKLPGTQQNL